MTGDISTLIEQIEQLLGDDPRVEDISLPAEFAGHMSSFDADWRILLQAVADIDSRLRALESGRRVLLEQILLSLRTLT